MRFLLVISTRAPRTRATREPPQAIAEGLFQPAPPARRATRDPIQGIVRRDAGISTRAPRTEGDGKLLDVTRRSAALDDFNPRPPHGGRRSVTGCRPLPGHGISTRAPRTEGDRSRSSCAPCHFNGAPTGLPEGISTRAPRTEGDTCSTPLDDLRTRHGISTRAPRTEGDFWIVREPWKSACS